MNNVSVTLGKAATQLIMLAVAITTIYPLVFVIFTSLKTNEGFLLNKFGLPDTLHVQNFVNAWQSSRIDQYFTNTVFLVCLSTAACVVIASLAGFAFSKLGFKLNKLFFYFSLAFMVIPFTVILTPFYQVIVKSGLINTNTGMILVYVAFNLPFGIYLMAQYYRGVPSELIQAGYIDGASIWAIFLKIMFPLGVPAQITLAILTFLACWNDLILSLLVLQSDTKRTLSVGIATMSGEFMTSVPLVSAAMVISILPVVAMFMFLQRYLISGVTLGAVK